MESIRGLGILLTTYCLPPIMNSMLLCAQYLLQKTMIDKYHQNVSSRRYILSPSFSTKQLNWAPSPPYLTKQFVNTSWIWLLFSHFASNCHLMKFMVSSCLLLGSRRACLYLNHLDHHAELKQILSIQRAIKLSLVPSQSSSRQRWRLPLGPSASRPVWVNVLVHSSWLNWSEH